MLPCTQFSLGLGQFLGGIPPCPLRAFSSDVGPFQMEREGYASLKATAKVSPLVDDITLKAALGGAMTTVTQVL